MTIIPENFSSKKEFKCPCGNIENMEHVYSCKSLNCEETEIYYGEIYSENVKQKVSEKFGKERSNSE